jgi:hypothetical protein
VTLKGDPEYAMGRNDAETQRLIDREVVYGPSSRAAFREAGICPGMKVLDIGTGPGSAAASVGMGAMLVKGGMAAASASAAAGGLTAFAAVAPAHAIAVGTGRKPLVTRPSGP